MLATYDHRLDLGSKYVPHGISQRCLRTFGQGANLGNFSDVSLDGAHGRRKLWEFALVAVGAEDSRGRSLIFGSSRTTGIGNRLGEVAGYGGEVVVLGTDAGLELVNVVGTFRSRHAHDIVGDGIFRTRRKRAVDVKFGDVHNVDGGCDAGDQG